jgi:hypothetical protein
VPFGAAPTHGDRRGRSPTWIGVGWIRTVGHLPATVWCFNQSRSHVLLTSRAHERTRGEHAAQPRLSSPPPTHPRPQPNAHEHTQQPLWAMSSPINLVRRMGTYDRLPRSLLARMWERLISSNARYLDMSSSRGPVSLCSECSSRASPRCTARSSWIKASGAGRSDGP